MKVQQTLKVGRQKKQVKVYRMLAEGTCEERIIARAQQKLILDAMVVANGGGGGLGSSAKWEASPRSRSVRTTRQSTAPRRYEFVCGSDVWWCYWWYWWYWW